MRITGKIWLRNTGLILFALWLMGNLFTGPLQHHFIFQPKPLPADYRYAFQADFRELQLETPQGGKINALWFRTAIPRKGLILYFHGNAGNLARWGHLHHFFTRQGYDFFVFDYRGFGKSQGRRNQELMYADGVAMYDYVSRMLKPEEIILYGRSLGTTFASRVAALRQARCLILETPFYSMTDLFYTYYPFLPRAFYLRYRFSNARSLRQVRMPVYIFQGDEDLVVPYRSASRLQPLLKAGDEFIRIPGGSHNNLLFYDIYNLKIEEILR